MGDTAMGESTTRRFLLIITINKDSDLAAAGKGIRSTLDLMPKSDMTMAFASNDGKTMGFLLQTHFDAPGIVRFLESPGKSITASNAIANYAVLVVELGRQFDTRNLGVAGTWLQLHPQKSAA